MVTPKPSVLPPAEAAAACLEASPFPAIRRIACDCEAGVLVLRGRVTLFYYKQVAQQAVANVPGVVGILNQIEVVDG